MKEWLRGLIEQILDEKLIDPHIVEEVRWIEQEIPITSLRDVAIGYAYGGFLGISMLLTQIKSPSYTPTAEDLEEIYEMVKRRLPQIVENIEKELNR